MVHEFAKKYKHALKLNVEKTADRKHFEDFDAVEDIFESLALTHQIPSSDKEHTLLFIDEIQECPKAIQQLRYFYEDIPELHVIAAGSLLEFAMDEVKSFPVGRVAFLYLHPLNFQEYLSAVGDDALSGHLRNYPVKSFAHSSLMKAFHRYAIIGGMPEVVSTDIERNSLSDLLSIYESIWKTYKKDVEKYGSNNAEKKMIRHILETAPFYLDQRIKFQGFGHSNYKSRGIGEAFRTLGEAKVLRLIYPTTDWNTPLKTNLRKSPRLQFLDTGIVNHILNIQAEMLAMEDLNKAYKGALIPHLITQELISIHYQTDDLPHFWVREKRQSQAEVDLLFPYGDIIVPIEIKSGKKGSLKSLHQFIEAADHPYAIRMYAGKLKVEKGMTNSKKPYLLLNLPYYLGTQLPQYVRWFVENYQ